MCERRKGRPQTAPAPRPGAERQRERTRPPTPRMPHPVLPHPRGVRRRRDGHERRFGRGGPPHVETRQEPHGQPGAIAAVVHQGPVCTGSATVRACVVGGLDGPIMCTSCVFGWWGKEGGGGGKLACRGMSGQPHSRRRSRLWPAHNAPAICRAAAPTALDRAATRRRSLAARSAARDPFCLNNHRSKIRRRAAAMRRRAAARSVSLADHATMRGTLPDSNSCHLCRDCEGASGHFQLSMCHSISFNAQQVVSSRGGLSNAGWKGFRPGLSQQLPRPRLTTRGHGVGFGRLLH